jgi:hypothetical protein
MELLNFDKLTYKLLPNIRFILWGEKGKLLSENAKVLCSGTAGIFKTLNGIMHRTNQIIVMMKPTLMQVT